MYGTKVLVLTPFSPVPFDAGHRRRVYQQILYLKAQNFSVSLMHIDFEATASWGIDFDSQGVVKEMVDDFYWYPGSSKIGSLPLNGRHHQLDEWIDDDLKYYFEKLVNRGSFDVVIIHNVWLSKLFDFVPKSALKVLEIHDVFSKRQEFYQKLNILPDFFLPTENDEIFGWKRCDAIISIQKAESNFIKSKCSVPVLDVAYAPEWLTPAPLDNYKYKNSDYIIIGFLASAHPFNVIGINNFVSRMNEIIKSSHAPVLLRLGGSVCKHVPDFGWVEKLGIVDDEGTFLESLDIVIAPVFDGSGFKVKTVDTLYWGRPLLCSSHAALGIDLPPTSVFDSADLMAKAIEDISFLRPSLTHLAQQQRKALKQYLETYNNQKSEAIHYLKHWRDKYLIDLTGDKFLRSKEFMKIFFLHLRANEALDVVFLADGEFGRKIDIYFDSRAKRARKDESSKQIGRDKRIEIKLYDTVATENVSDVEPPSFRSLQDKHSPNFSQSLKVSFDEMFLSPAAWCPVVQSLHHQNSVIEVLVVCEPSFCVPRSQLPSNGSIKFVETGNALDFDLINAFVSSEKVRVVWLFDVAKIYIEEVLKIARNFPGTRIASSSNGALQCDPSDLAIIGTVTDMMRDRMKSQLRDAVRQSASGLFCNAVDSDHPI